MQSPASQFVFLSHSSHDKPFVHRLHAALTVSRVDTFLDDKDIRVGESIPERVFTALSACTHVIYVISKSSLSSRWAAEELSSAKMRELSGGSLQIIPILIDDSEPPASIAHQKYVRCENWEQTQPFARLVRELLDLLGREPLATSAGDILFYWTFSDLLLELRNIVTHLAAAIDTSIIARMWNSDPRNSIGTWLLKKNLGSSPYAHVSSAIAELETGYGAILESTKQEFPKAQRLCELSKDLSASIWKYSADNLQELLGKTQACLRAIEEIESEYRSLSLSHFSVPLGDSDVYVKARENARNKEIEKALKAMSPEQLLKLLETTVAGLRTNSDGKSS